MKRRNSATRDTTPPSPGAPRASRRKPNKTARPRPSQSHGKEWELRLYIAGQTTRAARAFANLQQICDTYLAGHYHIEVIDLLKNPKLARGDQIVAVPTLVRNLPQPMRKILGDLSDTERVLVGLDLRERK